MSATEVAICRRIIVYVERMGEDVIEACFTVLSQHMSEESDA
jgi:hypothetical protein